MASAEDPIFNINFVREIESHPCLWNYNLSEYSKRNITEKAWAEVAKEIKDTVSNCRDRWRNIRGAFLRSLKKPPSGSGTNTKKKYYIDQYLEFLLPYIKSKSTTGNLKTLVENSENSESAITELQESTESQEIDDTQDIQSTASNIPLDGMENGTRPDTAETISKKTRDKKRKVAETPSATSNPADDAFVEWLKDKKEKNNKDISQEHPNMLFLRSLFPDMMKMTDKQNRRFRQKVVALMDSILDAADLNANMSGSVEHWQTGNLNMQRTEWPQRVASRSSVMTYASSNSLGQPWTMTEEQTFDSCSGLHQNSDY